MSDLVYRLAGVAEEAKMMGHTAEVALSNYIRVNDEHASKINDAAVSYREPAKEATPPATKESLLEQLKKLPKEEQAKLLMELLK